MTRELMGINRTLYKGLKAQALSELDALPENLRSSEAVLWLRAHAQADETERARQLGELANRFPNGEYGQMARQALLREAPYVKMLAAQSAPRGVLSRVSILGFLVIVAALLAILVGLGALLNTINQVNAPPTVSTQAAALDPLLKVPVLPDLSQPIRSDPHQVYAAGILHLNAVEDASLRIAAAPSGDVSVPATPLPKTRFYALYVTFDCKLNTCKQPPQATVALVLQDGTQVNVEDSLYMADGKDERLQPIGRNASTSGWLIFQIAQSAKAQALRISPVNENGSTQNVTPQVYDIPIP